jgi:hypothetical protein
LVGDSHSVKRAVWKRWLLLWPVMLGLIVYPVSNGILRVTEAIAGAALVAGLLWFYWNVLWLRIFVISGVVVGAVFLALPGHSPNLPRIQKRYLQSLKSYEGTRYVWGGENRIGIDCSGLVRKSLVNSLVTEGLTALNPLPLRQGIFIWWQDCSARALGAEYLQLTRRLFDADAINQIDSSRIQPGDLAVTVDGLHVLAYLGNDEWIEADPDAKTVLRLTTPSTNTWFDTPVTVLRWSQLDESRLAPAK